MLEPHARTYVSHSVCMYGYTWTAPEINHGSCVTAVTADIAYFNPDTCAELWCGVPCLGCAAQIAATL